ncbi:MAG TPA: DUF3460 family protein [Usitatibacter sp.]|nr:DUF3460 family protein [Usitatibacter sp.]
MYESEITRFIRELKARNPQIAELQRKNRATWWDKPQDLETWRERSEATVPQPGYVYFPLPKKKGDDPDTAGQVAAPTRPA